MDHEWADRVLIETYWNVKSIQLMLLVMLPKVLIETYWNVKTDGSATIFSLAFVLIETYWNVKFLPSTFLLYPVCINRNILECKGSAGTF